MHKPSPSGQRREAHRRPGIPGRVAAALATAALGAGAALAIGACGEDREGSVENIGGGTTGTGATTGTEATTGATDTTGAATSLTTVETSGTETGTVTGE